MDVHSLAKQKYDKKLRSQWPWQIRGQHPPKCDLFPPYMMLADYTKSLMKFLAVIQVKLSNFYAYKLL